MFLRHLSFSAAVLSAWMLVLLAPDLEAATLIGQLTDPPHPSIDASLDILSARCEQTGGQLTFVMEARGAIATSLPDSGDTMTYLWLLDTDENPATGQPHGNLGSEFNVRAVIGLKYGGGFVDVTGGEPGGGGGMLTVEDNVISITIWLPAINNAADFNWDCASFGWINGAYVPGNPETVVTHSDTLPYTPPARVTVTTPILELCPSGPAGGQLEVVLRDAEGNVLPNEEHVLTFHSTNEAVATVDADGLVTAHSTPQYHWQTPYVDVWADGVMADNSSVIRVNSADLGVVHQMYPAEHVTFCLVPMIEGVNLDSLTTVYQVVEATERAYQDQAVAVGNTPSGGGLEYLVLDVADDPNTSVCGASGNPMRFGWTWGMPANNSCYIANDPAHRVPQWFVLWHELGHGFTCSCNSFNLFCMGPSNPHNGAYLEGLASLAAMWSWRMIMTSSGGLGPLAVDNMDEQFRSYSGNWRQALVAYQQAGADYDILDANIVDGILLDMYDQFGIKTWFDLYSTFLPQEAPLPLSLDTIEKQADWFVAAFSASTGQDLRAQFASQYGFPFDDDAWPEILSAVEARVAARTWYPPAAIDGAPEPMAVGDRLLPNLPNPFSFGTELRFMLRSRVQARLTVHDVCGRRVASLVRGLLSPGEHRVVWDGRDESGHLLGSGVYWTRLVTPGSICRGKVTVVR